MTPRMMKQLVVMIAGLVVLVGAIALPLGCQQGSGGGLLRAHQDSERYTIRCVPRSDAEGYEQQCRVLADMLKQVKGLQADQVRVDTNAQGTTIYYGEYRRVASSRSRGLVFPPEYQRDVELIRSLSYQQNTPFFYAAPELIGGGELDGGELDVANAKGAYTLQVGVFYNTPTFDQRKEAAEQYVRVLRQEGYPAYLRHETVRSYVFVGDFAETDVVETPNGLQMGPRVEQFIARNPDEFKYVLENGHLIKRQIEGRLIESRSFLVRVPRPGGASFIPSQP